MQHLVDRLNGAQIVDGKSHIAKEKRDEDTRLDGKCQIHLPEKVAEPWGVHIQSGAAVFREKQHVQEAAGDESPYNEGRLPDAAQQAIKNEHHEDQTHGESQIIQGADPVPAVYHQLLDSGGNGKGDQQQNHGNHIGGKEWPYIVEKTAEPENGHQQASDHHGGVDGFDPKALTWQ